MLERAAERQADILLYLGALLLSVSAILFVAYQGGALAGLARFVILSGYTIGFIVLGLVLHRWERVREAGPVFLLVGALLVPLQFVALRTQVLDEGTLPNNVLWLLGSTVAGGFYYVLAWRGLGRLYVIPAAITTYLAWGSLAWVLGLPDEWYGVWFIGLVLPLHLAAVRKMVPGRRWVERLALTTAACAIVYAHVPAGSGFGDAGQLPAAYALLLSAAAAIVRMRPTVLALASLPALFALTAATTLWAGFDIGWWWQGSLTVVAGLGYLVLALVDEPARARRWALVAAIAGSLGLAAAHLGVQTPGARPRPCRWLTDSRVLEPRLPSCAGEVAGTKGRLRCRPFSRLRRSRRGGPEPGSAGSGGACWRRRVRWAISQRHSSIRGGATGGPR